MKEDCIRHVFLSPTEWQIKVKNASFNKGKNDIKYTFFSQILLILFLTIFLTNHHLSCEDWKGPKNCLQNLWIPFFFCRQIIIGIGLR